MIWNFFFIININSHESYIFLTCFIGPSKVTCPTDFWAGAGQADKCYCRAPAFIFRSVMFVDSLEFYSDKLVIFFILYKIILPGGSSCQILVIFSLFSVKQTITQNAVMAQPFHRYLLWRGWWRLWSKVGSWLSFSV